MRLEPFVLRSAEQTVGVARSPPVVDLELASIVVAMIAAGVSVVPRLSVHLVAPCSTMPGGYKILSLERNEEGCSVNLMSSYRVCVLRRYWNNLIQ